MADRRALDAFASRFQPLDEFVQQRMRRPSGKPYPVRGIRRLVESSEIPIARLGQVPFVDLERLADQLHRQTDASASTKSTADFTAEGETVRPPSI